MRAFLLFLALAFPVALLSPSFWSLVNMEFGAQRVGYVRDGVTQWATLGPKAPWPAWALVPEGARLTVKANFEPAPGEIAGGFGDFDSDEPPQLVVRRYQDALRAAGWSVTTWRFDATSPELPQRPIRTCIIEGARGGRTQRLSLYVADAEAAGAIHWNDGPSPSLKGARQAPCWPDPN